MFSLLTEGASSTHGFAWYRQGRRERLWLRQEGAIVLEEGLPLPEETAAVAEEPDEEGRLFVLMAKLTGISLDDVFGRQFQIFA